MAVKRLQYFMRGVSRMGCGASGLHSHAAHGNERCEVKEVDSWFPCAAWEPIRACVAGTREIKASPRHVEKTGCGASGLHSHAAHGNESDSAKGKRPAGGFFLQLDIKNFFNSVDRRILFSLLQKRLRKAVRQGKVDEATAVSYRNISHIILKQDVGQEAFMAATPAELARIPAYKRLINAGKDKELPIGNLTSQFFANVYLNELDQFVKHQSSTTGKAGGLKDSEPLKAVKNLEPPKGDYC